MGVYVDNVSRIYKVLKMKDGRKTEFRFSRFNNEGFSDEQIEFIFQIISKYMEKFSMLRINIVVDFYYYDLNFYNNENGKKYLDYPEIGEWYGGNEKKIGLNHILMSNMLLDDKEIVENIIGYKEKLDDIKSQIDDIKEKYKESPMGEYLIYKYIKPVSKEDMEHEINMSMDAPWYFDIILIREIEETQFIKRIVLHEIGHAVCESLKLNNNKELKFLYKEVHDGFEDFDEFIAECFMAAEMSCAIELANKVSHIIYKCAGIDKEN